MILGKNKKLQIEQMVGGILESQDLDIIVVDRTDCQLLHANSHAKKRMQGEGRKDPSCRVGYSKLFPGICEFCPNRDEHAPKGLSTFDVQDMQDRYYSVTCNNIEWLDGQDATIMFLTDVHDQRTAQDRLFNLAYIDQLTGIPNRQKFKEDFEKLHEDIAANKLWGLITIFDLDDFKTINDTYGHNTGDVMLRRLTEHLQSDEDFRGHLYRLGGDEFVLMYTVDPTTFESEEAMRGHYLDILSKAFLTYTMPNIDKGCTISMGVAFLPKDGDSSSELLRKADIALYEAKKAGRNQLMIFEDKYDKAEKFKDLYINIQPVLMQSGRTFGYELIDRGNDDNEE